MKLELLKVSSLEKVFPDEEPRAFDGRVEGFLNETVSFQAAWIFKDTPDERAFTSAALSMRVESPVSAYIRRRCVRFVPVLFPTFPDADDNYLRKTPGLYPDALTDAHGDMIRAYSIHWEAMWFDIEAGEEIPAGVYPIDIVIENAEGEALASAHYEYERLNACLPAQTLKHTKWFHTDGLCDRYHVEMFSEDFWRIAENYIRSFVRRSMNVLLTPIHTPPLDTAVGGERRTCQLVDIEVTENGYRFGFDKLVRWIEMAERCGVEYFEMAHLFTQWGAKHAPKIVAKVNGEEKRIFGWETDALSEEYTAFLDAYLPALVRKLDEMGIRDRCIFHISDEPSKSAVEEYLKARSAVQKHLEGFAIIDALSDLELYKSGAVQSPVPANNHIRPFLEEKVPNLWTYYCVGQYKDVSNCFVAMPSARTRIIGIQMFKYDIVGFLQWAFNFYNAQFSKYAVNPFLSTDGEGFSPAGDCFQVYPGDGGEPIESIRMMTMAEAVYDYRALRYLADMKGKPFAMALVEAGVAPIEFDAYPTSASYIMETRKKVNRAIMEALR